mmetsp:Transcript_25844/g.74654  ORF Transcript_25844/g.74654 Transcript_25844/m.74654 type:complete len:319 (-) Transcript_25844:13-969(-)
MLLVDGFVVSDGGLEGLQPEVHLPRVHPLENRQSHRDDLELVLVRLFRIFGLLRPPELALLRREPLEPLVQGDKLGDDGLLEFLAHLVGIHRVAATDLTVAVELFVGLAVPRLQRRPPIGWGESAGAHAHRPGLHVLLQAFERLLDVALELLLLVLHLLQVPCQLAAHLVQALVAPRPLLVGFPNFLPRHHAVLHNLELPHLNVFREVDPPLLLAVALLFFLLLVGVVIFLVSVLLAAVLDVLGDDLLDHPALPPRKEGDDLGDLVSQAIELLAHIFELRQGVGVHVGDLLPKPGDPLGVRLALHLVWQCAPGAWRRG